MTYVVGMEHDVFFSYAHDNDLPDAAGHRWVRRFVEDLMNTLRFRLATPDNRRISHFFDDQSANHGNFAIEDLLVHARQSAVFVAICSPHFAIRDWPRRETEAFHDSARDASRIFAIEMLPLDEGDSYPEPVGSKIRNKFYVDGENSVAMTIQPDFHGKAYHDRIEDVANSIKMKLKSLAGGNVAKGPAPLAKILLGQVTDDLDNQRDEVCRYLAQYDIGVLPATTYPQGSAQFKQAFEKDLSEARLYVQLVGQTPSKRPPDLPEGYLAWQLNRAQQAGMECLNWRSPELNVSTIANEHHRAIVSRADILAMGFESFKEKIVARVRNTSKGAEPVKDVGSFVFVNADPTDRKIGQALCDEFARRHMMAFLAQYEGSASDVRKDLTDSMKDCSALIFVYGQATPIWLRDQVRMFWRLQADRGAPPRIIAVIDAPPRDKPDPGVTIPNARYINCRDHLEDLNFQTLVAELVN